jgi:hypothetical protein
LHKAALRCCCHSPLAAAAACSSPLLLDLDPDGTYHRTSGLIQSWWIVAPLPASSCAVVVEHISPLPTSSYTVVVERSSPPPCSATLIIDLAYRRLPHAAAAAADVHDAVTDAAAACPAVLTATCPAVLAAASSALLACSKRQQHWQLAPNCAARYLNFRPTPEEPASGRGERRKTLREELPVQHHDSLYFVSTTFPCERDDVVYWYLIQ